MHEIFIATGVLTGIGLLVGLFLGIFGKLLAVPVDEKVQKIRECLPGNNCGGCGYSGCDALASAIAQEQVGCDACPVGGASTATQIAEIMGISLSGSVRRVAFVRCSGHCDQAKYQYEYYGVDDCRLAADVPGHGSKACRYGCTGLGSCVNACPFDAIRMVRGCAQVIPERCRACGICISVCPRHLIELVPESAVYAVACSSKDRGKAVKAVCGAGCIGCGLCAKQCKAGAITLSDHVARIDSNLCTACGACAAKCPAHIIVMRTEPMMASEDGVQPVTMP